MILQFKVKKGWHVTPCPAGKESAAGIIHIGSMLCEECSYNRGMYFPKLKEDEVYCSWETGEGPLNGGN